MADAIPVTKSDEPKTAKKPAPKPAAGAPVDVAHHIPAAPGNHYKLPDGTVCEDH